jgi:osmoprotectant transport system substrate-binding protein
VVPEYLGTALTSLESAADAGMSGPVPVQRELVRALAGRHVQVLQPAAAQNQNGLMVTRAMAARLRPRTVSDLGPFAQQLILGGAPECPQRPYRLPGLRRVYRLEFARLVPLATAYERIEAVGQGVVDVVAMDTTAATSRTVTSFRLPTTVSCSRLTTSCQWSTLERRRGMEFGWPTRSMRCRRG